MQMSEEAATYVVTESMPDTWYKSFYHEEKVHVKRKTFKPAGAYDQPDSHPLWRLNYRTRVACTYAAAAATSSSTDRTPDFDRPAITAFHIHRNTGPQSDQFI